MRGPKYKHERLLENATLAARGPGIAAGPASAALALHRDPPGAPGPAAHDAHVLGKRWAARSQGHSTSREFQPLVKPWFQVDPSFCSMPRLRVKCSKVVVGRLVKGGKLNTDFGASMLKT